MPLDTSPLPRSAGRGQVEGEPLPKQRLEGATQKAWWVGEANSQQPGQSRQRHAAPSLWSSGKACRHARNSRNAPCLGPLPLPQALGECESGVGALDHLETSPISPSQEQSGPQDPTPSPARGLLHPPRATAPPRAAACFSGPATRKKSGSFTPGYLDPWYTIPKIFRRAPTLRDQSRQGTAHRGGQTAHRGHYAWLWISFGSSSSSTEPLHVPRGWRRWEWKPVSQPRGSNTKWFHFSSSYCLQPRVCSL